MIKITILSKDTRNNKGISKTSGKPYDMDFQTGYAHTFDKKTGQPNPYPEKIELTLDKNPAGMPEAYEPGEYQLHPASLFVGKYGLEVAPKLVPLVKKAS
jgi:hypothetical protein